MCINDASWGHRSRCTTDLTPNEGNGDPARADPSVNHMIVVADAEMITSKAEPLVVRALRPCPLRRSRTQATSCRHSRTSRHLRRHKIASDEPKSAPRRISLLGTALYLLGDGCDVQRQGDPLGGHRESKCRYPEISLGPSPGLEITSATVRVGLTSYFD